MTRIKSAFIRWPIIVPLAMPVVLLSCAGHLHSSGLLILSHDIRPIAYTVITWIWYLTVPPAFLIATYVKPRVITLPVAAIVPPIIANFLVFIFGHLVPSPEDFDANLRTASFMDKVIVVIGLCSSVTYLLLAFVKKSQEGNAVPTTGEEEVSIK